MWELKCICGKERIFTNQSNYNRALKGNRLCNSCARKGQRRTPQQCQHISASTKKAMSNPLIIQKIKDGMNTPENKALRSEHTKRQMALQKQNTEKWNSFITKSKLKRTIWWGTASNSTKNFILNSAHSAMKKKWKDPLYKISVSLRMTGDKNHFYGKQHSNETKIKLRKKTTERLIKFWKNNTLTGINTKPELKMQSRLQTAKIKFQTPFVVENKIYDLYLPDYNTIIEIDGCYWHSKNIPISQMNKHQLRRWKNDRFKDILAHKHGYKLLRIWEDEIEQFNIDKELIINE